jgi:DNA invertase Pin-like site-specific DNA recombinase
LQEFIAYRRVTQSERRRPAARLEAQAAAILKFVQSRAGVLLRDFVEREAGKGSQALELRPQLQEAMALAKERQAVLVVSTLDRLSRNVRFLSGLLEAGVEFAAADTPDADAFMLHIYAGVAQRAREQVGGRISASLQAKKRAALASGQPNPLGNPSTLKPHIQRRAEDAQAFADRLAPTLRAYRSAGMSQRQMVEALNEQGIRAASGGTWSLVQLQRVLARLPEDAAA